ncbi:hypothetical protein NBH00_18740 [Paraconexibacter antarcticus]|uniref:Uncharacterized protein n=1 Tax=Paraconexibacter antarcticus TaxID=2949664 RepID=A0ABY5DR22_9ACTN|nr:hypothetical protein [Paraconexibacter antarcticus]UTI63376.1 hypothetical protein NBH00_18740 [Paraconexibacter antarcticus]
MTQPAPQPSTAVDSPAAPPDLPADAETAEETAVSGWPAKAWNWACHRLNPDPELDPDNRFEFTKVELVERLKTDDPDIAQEILAEAEQIAERMVDGRAESVERRAATLQSATAIAGSFSSAGGTLLVTRINGRPWQVVIGLLLLWVTGSLGLCGWRATQASSKIHPWSVLPSTAILTRASQTIPESRIERAVQVLRAAGWNARYARYKVTMLERAGEHLTRASLGLPVLIAAVAIYALRH